MARDPSDFYAGNEINSALKFVKEPDYDLWRRNQKMDQGCYNREAISEAGYLKGSKLSNSQIKTRTFSSE